MKGGKYFQNVKSVNPLRKNQNDKVEIEWGSDKENIRCFLCNLKDSLSYFLEIVIFPLGNEFAATFADNPLAQPTMQLCLTNIVNLQLYQTHWIKTLIFPNPITGGRLLWYQHIRNLHIKVILWFSIDVLPVTYNFIFHHLEYVA